MVNLTTTYDSSIKKKVFVLKGDEGYARTTDMILNLIEYGNSYDNIETMRVGLAMNVLRDIGESTIVIYNGDKVLRTIPWSDTPSQMTFDEDLTWDETNQLLIWGDATDTSKGVGFPYETDHNIYARYMGSKQCMMSVSDTININKPVPPKYKSTIHNTHPTRVYDVTGAFSLQIQFDCTTAVSVQRNLEFDLYVDGLLYGTYTQTLPANRKLSLFYFELNGTGKPQLDKGLHHIRVYFKGDEYTSSSETEYDISLGYKLEVTSYDSPFVYAQNWLGDPWDRISLKLTDHFKNPVPNQELTVKFRSPNGRAYAYGSTDANGVVDMNVMENSEVMRLMVNATSLQTEAFTSETVDEYSVEEFDIPVFTYGTINLSTSKEIIAPNIQTTITATVNPPYKGLPIYMGDEYGSIYTNDNGVATLTIDGVGDGNHTLMGSIGSEIYDFVQFGDYLQYWDSTDNLLLNQKADLWNIYFTSSATGYQFRPVKYDKAYMYLKSDQYELSSEKSWRLTFRVKAVSNCRPVIQSHTMDGLQNQDFIEVLKIQKSDEPTEIRIYKNGTLVTNRTQTSSNDGYPMIGLNPTNSSKLNQTFFTINNIKLIQYPIDTDFDGA